MNVVFFGSSKHVIPIIEVIRKNFSAKGGPASGWDLALVVTTEKSPTDPVRSYCIKSKVCYYVATDFRNKKIINEIKEANPDIGILASFGAIIPNKVLNLFPHGIINIHPSLLPKYRGPTPVQSAILNGDKTAGVTFIKLDVEVDHGPILFQTKENILPNDTSDSLYERLFKLSASSIVDTIELYLKGEIKPQKQNHSKATFTKRLAREDGYVDISKLNPSADGQNSKLLNRMIRAYHPWPGVWTKLKVKSEKLKVIKFLPRNLIQVEGKKPMNYKDFINGYPAAKNILSMLQK